MNMRPRKQQLLRWLPDRLVRTRASAHAGARYLTFDDGPDPEHTPRLLDLLAKHRVHASFFLVGLRAEQHPSLVQRMVDEGHAIGNHSWNHWSFNSLSLQQQMDEFCRTDQLLCQYDSEPQHLLRPPQGYLDARLLLHCARHGRSIVYWSYDSMDYQKPATDALVAGLRAKPPQPGDIVLAHDDSDIAIDALGVLLPEWLAQGHHFRALPRKEP